MRSDPIGLEGGLNTYGYVGGSPLHGIDPKGLVEWTGTYLGGSLLVGFYDFYTLRTKCINGKKGFARVQAFGFTVGFGVPVTFTGGTVTLEDNLSEVNPNVFNGIYRKFAYGFGFGLTAGGSQIQLGGASTYLGALKPALGAGYDMSISGSAGLSQVVVKKIENCGCEI